jgi:hypothetical protein
VARPSFIAVAAAVVVKEMWPGQAVQVAVEQEHLAVLEQQAQPTWVVAAAVGLI